MNKFQFNQKKIIFILLCLQQAAISFNVTALSALVPAIARDLTIPNILAAKMIPYYMVPYGAGALIFAPLAKTISTRTLMVATMFLFAITNLCCGMAKSIDDILLLRVLMGVASAGVVPLGLILIGQTFEKQIRGRMVGLFFSASFVASMTGIILSGLVHWHWQFFIPAGMGLLTAGLLLLFQSKSLGKLEGKINYLNIFRDVNMLRIFIFITLISTLYHGVDRWLGVYMDQVYHLNQVAISFLFVIIAVSGALGQNFGGHLSDKKGRLFSCRLGILVLAAAIFLLSFKSNPYILGIILILLAVGWTVGHNGVSTVLTDMPEETRSEIASLNSSLRFLGGGLGFSLSGIFITKSFFATFFWISICMFAMSLLLKRIIPETR